jgi:hypothetical protein
MILTIEGEANELNEIKARINAEYANAETLRWGEYGGRLETVFSSDVNLDDTFWKSLLEDYRNVDFSGTGTSKQDSAGFWMNLEFESATNLDGTREFAWFSGSSGWV